MKMRRCILSIVAVAFVSVMSASAQSENQGSAVADAQRAVADAQKAKSDAARAAAEAAKQKAEAAKAKVIAAKAKVEAEKARMDSNRHVLMPKLLRLRPRRP